MIIVFIQTDLPEPVAPATSKCGILFSSQYTGSPIKSLPKVNNNCLDLSLNFSLFVSSDIRTITFSALGISTPTALLPGIGASILISLAAKPILILSEIPLILFTLIFSSGTISNLVTLGPMKVLVNLAFIPKLLNISISFCPFTSAEFLLMLLAFEDAILVRSDIGGK